MWLNADALLSSLTLNEAQTINQVSHLLSSSLNQILGSLTHNEENNEGKFFLLIPVEMEDG